MFLFLSLIAREISSQQINFNCEAHSQGLEMKEEGREWLFCEFLNAWTSLQAADKGFAVGGINALIWIGRRLLGFRGMFTGQVICLLKWTWAQILKGI